MEAARRRDWVVASAAGAALGLAALTRAPLWLGPLFLLLLGAGWVICGANRWIPAFLASALLLPPLPLPGGDSGPHPAAAVALLGLAAGAARIHAWRFRLGPVPAALVLLFGALLLSVPMAALYSGGEAALGTLARVGLFGIGVHLFFYLSAGPGRGFPAGRLIRLVFWTGFVCALLACVDFYYQLPAPARFAEQYVWLPQGVFRRAQGMFYEASTLGLFCAFWLAMAAAMAVRGERFGLARWALALGSIVQFSALMFSFSRAAVVNLLVALAAMAWMERRRMGAWIKAGAGLAAAGTAGAALIYALFPEFLGHYGQRLLTGSLFLAESPNLLLSRRLDAWFYLLDWIREHPGETLLGVGYKTLPYTKALGRPVIADNMYLSMLVETGWLGLAALAALNAAVLAETHRLARRGQTEIQRFLGLWMFCAWCGLAVQMASGDILTYWRVLPVVFGALGAAIRHEDPVS